MAAWGQTASAPEFNLCFGKRAEARQPGIVHVLLNGILLIRLAGHLQCMPNL